MLPSHPYFVNTLNQQEFEALFDNAAIGIITTNPQGEIVMVNQFALQQFGYNREELIRQKIEILIPTRSRGRHVGYRDDYNQNNPHSRPMGSGLDLSGQKKDGSEFPVEVSLSIYKTPEGQFSIAFINDITVRKASEQALIQLNIELEGKVATRTQRLQEALEREQGLSELKSRFVSMASHEFRTPLSTILSSAYLVSKYVVTDEQPKREKHIQRIVSSVNMLTDILNDFLSVGKIEEGKISVRPSSINIKEWTETLRAEIEPILKEGQQINYVHEGTDHVLLDPSLLRHIVQNLLSNAIKFSPVNTDIEIFTRCNEHRFSLSVKDKGMGISKEDQQHLFERFFRGANAINVQGTGLGLHIVSKYAELMDGRLSCESDLNSGTTFTVLFQLQTDNE